MRCALVMAVVMVGCGGGTSTSSTTQVIPERALTVGDALLTSLPAGAEILVELDLARLRANPIIGGIATDLLAAPPAIAGAPEAPIDGATAVALAAYRVGTPAATTITVVAGGTRPSEAVDLGDGRWALALEGDVADLLATAGGAPSIASDAALMTVRAWAMPPAAEAASLRVAAHLTPEARTALADAHALDAAPAVVSVWGDVVDDLALVVRLADQPHRARPVWAPALGRLLARAAADPALGALGLQRPIAEAEIRREKTGVTVTVLVAPGRLRRAVERWHSHRPPPGSPSPVSLSPISPSPVSPSSVSPSPVSPSSVSPSPVSPSSVSPSPEVSVQ